MSKTPTPGLTPQTDAEAARLVLNDKKTLRVKADRESVRQAAWLARESTRRRLETVLAAFVGDMAVALERPGSWEAERVGAWLGSHVWECEPEDEADAAGPRLREEDVMGSAYGAYPWDGWEKHALAQGVAADLATLGRAVIREARQHGWNEREKALCGWTDDGRAMLRLALKNPALARKRWGRLLETDGGRYDPETGKAL
jgi:hypothetical protein